MSIGENHYEPEGPHSPPHAVAPDATGTAIPSQADPHGTADGFPPRPPAAAIPLPGPATGAARMHHKAPGQISIAMIGPSGGGKTSFLQALLHSTPDAAVHGSFRVVDDGSGLADDLLGRIDDYQFPGSTMAAESAVWTIVGTTPEVAQNRRFWQPRHVLPGTEVRFDLVIHDLPGGSTIKPDDTEVLGHLADADGLLLLIDPERLMAAPAVEAPRRAGAERRTPKHTFAHLNRLVRSLDRKAIELGDRRPPQVLSVCVGKLDNPEVYRRACDLGLIESEDGHVPYVPGGEQARALFVDLCSHSHEPHDRRLPETLETYFERIDYHVVSSIGYFIDPRAGFDEEKMNNVEQRDGEHYMLQHNPLQVWETLLDLYHLIREGR
jgi:hypothetical protein